MICEKNVKQLFYDIKINTSVTINYHVRCKVHLFFSNVNYWYD